MSLNGDFIDDESHIVRNGQTYYLLPPQGRTGLGEATSTSADGRTIVGHIGTAPAVWHC